MFDDLSDKDVLARLTELGVQAKRQLAQLIALLLEVEDRRLHERRAHSSLYSFCVHHLGMAEASAQRRIMAARLVRRFPVLLGLIERGQVTLSTLELLREHVTEENIEELVDATAGRTRREVEEVLARRAPKPDAPQEIEPVESFLDAAGRLATGDVPGGSGRRSSAPGGPAGRVSPLSGERFKVQLTIGRATLEKLDRVRDLMRHRNPSGDLEVLFDAAITALLVKLEKERLAKTDAPRPRRGQTKPGRIRAAVRREVFERDGEQCTYVDGEGNRCRERGRLELDHVVPRALGGDDTATNLRVRCQTHNLLDAEEKLGHVATQHRKHGAAPSADVVAVRRLVAMGFGEHEARGAHAALRRRRPRGGLRMHDLVREAIRARRDQPPNVATSTVPTESPSSF